MNISALFLSAALFSEPPAQPVILGAHITDAGIGQQWVKYEHHCPDQLWGAGDATLWVTIIFTSEPGAKYTVLSSSTMGSLPAEPPNTGWIGERWTSAGLPITATDFTTTWEGGFADAPARFFEIQKIECITP
jgi:hypothetical protein